MSFPIRDIVVRRILRLLDGESSYRMRRISSKWLRCFDARWLSALSWHRYDGFTDALKCARVHTVVIYNSFVNDVSALGSVHMLELHECHNITDVSALGMVHTLVLDNCSGVTDVSALATVHTLTLDRCDGVQDVSTLGTVHALTLLSCSSVISYWALITVHTLCIDGHTFKF